MTLTCGSALEADVWRLRGRLAALARHTEFQLHPSTIPHHVYFTIGTWMSDLGASADAGPVVGDWYDDVATRDPDAHVVSSTLVFSRFAGEEASEASRMLGVGDQRSLPAMQWCYPIMFAT